MLLTTRKVRRVDYLLQRFDGWTTFALHHPRGSRGEPLALASCFTDDCGFPSKDFQPSYTISCHHRVTPAKPDRR